VLGTVCSFSREARSFGEEDRRAVELLAERAATAVDNFRLYDELCTVNSGLECEVVRRTEEVRVAQEKLAAQERLAAIGEFAAMVIHEMRHPLAAIALSLSAIERHVATPSVRASLGLAFEETISVDRLLRELVEYSKPLRLDRRLIEVSDLCREVASTLLAQSDFEGRGIEVVASRPNLAVEGDPDKLRQVVTSILLNAMEATVTGGQVRCSIEPLDVGVVLRVVSGGPPIACEARPRLTEPFFTTKPSGTGLGLPIVKQIVQAHGGTLRIDSDAERGTCVTVLLPWHLDP
jgi:signal transduction histidine kinase